MSDPARRPELLAPAGSLEAFFAAMEAGADAVYCGLQEFSARAKAKNLTLAELEGMLNYAHGRGRRIYVTVNTLIKEAELPRLAEVLAALEGMGADGVILQDLAVWRLARQHFPGLALHASTQMTVHNSAGVRMLERMGFSRAVLARELSLEEIAAIRRRTTLELEHFVHGALCFSFSGQCYFSSFLGGKSGNRGRCAQPCRRRYRYRNRDGYYFSPNDLSAIDLLPELAAAGICSLKIEGRMKSAEYVANVVGAYRRVLDTPVRDRPQALQTAKEMLKQSFGRKPTKGFLTGPTPTDIAIPALQGATGRFLGEVTFARGDQLSFKTRDRLHLGDRLRVQPQTDQAGKAFTIKELQAARKPVKLVQAGAVVTVRSPFRDAFRVGDAVFKVSSEQAFTLSEAACRRRLQQAEPAREPLALNVALDDTTLRLQATVAGITLERQFSVPIYDATDNPLSAATLQTVFERTAEAPFLLQDLHCAPLPPVVIPPSSLKEVRRTFYRELRQSLAQARESRRRAHLQAALESLLPELPPQATTSPAITVGLGSLRDSHLLSDAEVDRLLVPLTAGNQQQVPRLGQRLAGRADAVVWDVPFILFDAEWQATRDAVRQLAERGFHRFRVNNLGHLPLFDGLQGMRLMTGYRLFTLNSQAALAWGELGLEELTLYIEDDRDNLRQLLARPIGLPASLTVYAPVPLITSRIALRDVRPDQPVLSDRGDAYRVAHQGGLTTVTAEHDFSLIGRLDQIAKLGCANLLVELGHLGPFSPRGKQVLDALRRNTPLPGTSTFNFDSGLE